MPTLMIPLSEVCLGIEITFAVLELDGGGVAVAADGGGVVLATGGGGVAMATGGGGPPGGGTIEPSLDMSPVGEGKISEPRSVFSVLRLD